MKKIILFDIDYTLFDTELFRNKLYKEISQALGMDAASLTNIQKEIIQEVRKEVGYFNPEQFSHLLAKKLQREKDEKIILDALFYSDNFKDNYYSEVMEVLEELSHIIRIGIFSKGHSKLQQEKLYAIKHLFEENDIHITENKFVSLPSLVEKYKNDQVYMVDDVLDVLYAAKKLNKNIHTIWIKRGFYAEKQKAIEGFTPDVIIENLKEIMPMFLKG